MKYIYVFNVLLFHVVPLKMLGMHYINSVFLIFLLCTQTITVNVYRNAL